MSQDLSGQKIVGRSVTVDATTGYISSSLIAPVAMGLDDLIDVNATSPSPSQVLTWDGAEWVPVAPAAMPDVTISLAEIDLGSQPVLNGAVVVTDASVSAVSRILVTPSGDVATGGSADDWEWDSIQFAALAGSGEFTVYWRASDYVTGKRKIFYSIGVAP